MRSAAAAILVALATLPAPSAAEGPASGRPTGLLSDQDRRTPQEPDAWPWSSIGRVNVIFGRGRRGACTGVLVAPDRVATAAHCLFDRAGGRWAEPKDMHFVAGLARDRYKAHALIRAVFRPPGYEPGGGVETLAGDWALLTLEKPLALKPVPVRAIADEAFGAALAEGETARAGYGADRPYLLSLQRGCAVRTIAGRPGLLAHDCDTMQGDSGSPILLIRGVDAWVIGLSTAVSSAFLPGVGHRARFGVGVSAAGFAGRLVDDPPR